MKNITKLDVIKQNDELKDQLQEIILSELEKFNGSNTEFCGILVCSNSYLSALKKSHEKFSTETLLKYISRLGYNVSLNVTKG